MKRILLLAMIATMTITSTAQAVTLDEKKAQTATVKPMAGYACDYWCDADTLGGLFGWQYVWDNVGDVGNSDVLVGGLNPDRINGYAWTRYNDGPGSGVDADLLDGLHGVKYVKNNAGQVDNYDVKDKALAMRKINGLKAELAGIKARLSALDGK